MEWKIRKVLAGQQFGEWFVTNSYKRENKRTYWLCKCSCGYVSWIQYANLMSGNTKRCKRCAAKLVGKKRATHGHTKNYRSTSEYYAWRGIKRRCLDPKCPNFNNYGGKGVKVCDRWLNFSFFIRDMGEKPTPKHQIDRIDPFGDYTPENCRWVTPKENSRNRRKPLRHVCFNGQDKPLMDWVQELDLNYGTIYNRLKVGKSVQEAFSK